MTYVEEVQKHLVTAFPKLGEADWRGLLDQYTLLVMTRGKRCTPADVHDAWSVHTMRTRPGHPSILPFGDLPEEVQELDVKYALAIRRIARVLKNSGILKPKVG